MILTAAIDRGTVADYVQGLVFVYIVLIFIRVLLTWIPRMPYNRPLRAVVGFIEDVTDPYLNMFRRVIPPLGGGGFARDLSPMLAMILLYAVGAIVVGVIRGGAPPAWVARSTLGAGRSSYAAPWSSSTRHRRPSSSRLSPWAKARR